MKHPVLMLLGLLAVAAFPAAQAVEILRWERMPLAVPLKVGQERIVFRSSSSSSLRGSGVSVCCIICSRKLRFPSIRLTALPTEVFQWIAG